MKRILAFSKLFLFCACACFALAQSAHAEGDDGEDEHESDDNTIRTTVQGPVQSVNCTATPPTVQILGLTIDVSKLVTHSSTATSTSTSTGTSTSTSTSTTRDHGEDDQGDDNQGNEDGGDDDGEGHGTSCSSIVGLTVRLGLVNDQPPLQALNGKLVGGYNSSIFVQGPVQAVDTSTSTITVLGLTISTLTSNGNTSTSLVDLSTLLVGDQVTAFLKSDKAPLTAYAIMVKHQDNGIMLNLSGDDDDEDKECEIEEVVSTPPNTTPTGSLTSATTTSTTATTSKASKQKSVKKVYHFKKTIKGANGHVALRGLPAGTAKISIRKGGKIVAHKTVKILPHATQSVTVQLHGKKKVAAK